MRRTETYTETNHFWECDICGHRLTHHRICIGCGKDICNDCIIWQEYDPFTGDHNGDYPTCVCGDCDRYLSKLFESDVRPIQEKIKHLNQEIEALRHKWLLACRSKSI